MKYLLRFFSAFFVVLTLITTTGCASTPANQGTGAYGATGAAGAFVDDSVITSKVKALLSNDPNLRSGQINVDTYKGVVRLSGFVNSRDDLDRAVEIAHSVNGVKSVKNDLRLKNVGPGVSVDDSVITSKVKALLSNEPNLRSGQINVETYKGVVQLSGFVTSQADIRRAVEIARNVNGVKAVKNDMRLR